jgi:hypothetical protein
MPEEISMKFLDFQEIEIYFSKKIDLNPKDYIEYRSRGIFYY